MQLSKINIPGTENTPEIVLDPEGTIKIKGKGMALNNVAFSGQIMNWIEAYVNSPAETTYVIIAFEYLNSFCTTKLTSLLKKISEVILQKHNYQIKWYYEEDDEDILERGEYISATLNMPINFIMTYDIKTCC
jgi:hypothetical protein